MTGVCQRVGFQWAMTCQTAYQVLRIETSSKLRRVPRLIKLHCRAIIEGDLVQAIRIFSSLARALNHLFPDKAIKQLNNALTALVVVDEVAKGSCIGEIARGVNVIDPDKGVEVRESAIIHARNLTQLGAQALALVSLNLQDEAMEAANLLPDTAPLKFSTYLEIAGHFKSVKILNLALRSNEIHLFHIHKLVQVIKTLKPEDACKACVRIIDSNLDQKIISGKTY